MFKKFFNSLFILGCIGTVGLTQAAHLPDKMNLNDIQIGIPSYGGTGCPIGSASATLSPDNKSLSLIFDEYLVEAGGDTRKTIARKSCNIAIPVHVPSGYSVSVFKVDYRGYIYLPYRSSARFSAEYFFAGMRGPKLIRNFRGELDDEYLINDKLGIEAMVWSPCGADVNLRVNSSMMVRSNRYRDEVLATVDSADVTAGLVYHFQLRKCGQRPGRW